MRRAWTLGERLRQARAALDHAPSSAVTADDAGVDYLELWNRAFAPGNRAAFLRRLAWDGITLEQAAIALSNVGVSSGQAAPGVSESSPSDDAWLERFEHLVEDLGAPRAIDEALPFAEIWTALAEAGWRLLERQRPSAGAELGEAAARALQRQLAAELSRLGELAAYEAFRREVSEAGDPHDRTGRTHYDAFIDRTLRSHFLELGQQYPVWLRHTHGLIESWAEATAEMLARLEADRHLIEQACGCAVTRVANVEPGLSDPHHGRRRVARLLFESGLAVVYKPRPVGGERALNELITWLQARGVEPPLRCVPVVDRGSYGWMAHVEQEAFSTLTDVKEYYRRAGGLLCLMHVLRGRDLHWENVIATRDGPVVVDAELLLQPAADGEAPPSPLATGLLSCLQTGPDGEIEDVGGLRGDRIAMGPTAERVWTNVGTDAIRVSEVRQPVGPRRNRVLLDGAVQDPGAHADALLAGFTAMYRGLLDTRDALLAPGGPFESLRTVRARILVRSSQQYAAALHALSAPRFQRDGRHWGCALEALNRRYRFSVTEPRTWRFVGAEREALERLDVPAFWSPADGTDVLAGERVIAPRYFHDSGLHAAEALLRGLSDDDLARQTAGLRRALGQSTRSRFSQPLELPSGERGVEDYRAALTATATWIARELVTRELTDDAERPSALCLYDGVAGPAVFLAALAAATGDEGWRREAARAIAPLEGERWADEGGPGSTGATTGVGSVVYALTLIARILGDGRYLEAARRAARVMSDDRVEADPAPDVSAGVAGALLALLALYTASDDAAILARAARCGRLLLARQVPAGAGAAWLMPDGAPRSGFAHGAAGIAYALTRLFATTGDAALLPAIARAHAFERGLFSPADRNWPAFAANADEGAVLMTAWCNGAAGVGLARAYAATVFDDPMLAEEVAVAIDTSARVGAAQADHLCCGNTGRADALFTIGQILPNRAPMQLGMQIAGSVVRRARERGHFRLSTAGAEYEVFTPGFFTGLSGIGYALLRLAHPRRLPSVLAFLI